MTKFKTGDVIRLADGVSYPLSPGDLGIVLIADMWPLRDIKIKLLDNSIGYVLPELIELIKDE